MNFIDRVVEFPTRVKLTAVIGEEDTYDVETVPGTVTEEGTPLTAENLNQITTDIQSDISGAMSGINIDANGNVGFRNLQCGTAKSAKIRKKKRGNVTVKFPQAFTKTPIVVALIHSGSAGVHKISLKSRSTTQAVFSVYNGGSATYNISFSWIAFVK